MTQLVACGTRKSFSRSLEHPINRPRPAERSFVRPIPLLRAPPLHIDLRMRLMQMPCLCSLLSKVVPIRARPVHSPANSSRYRSASSLAFRASLHRSYETAAVNRVRPVKVMDWPQAHLDRGVVLINVGDEGDHFSVSISLYP